MNVKRFNRAPFHVFLLPVFFVWHVVNQYFGLIPLRFSGRFLLIYLVLALVLFLAGKLLFRNTIKAGCWATLLLLIFFFWGAIHDFLRTLHLPVLLTSYKFLFPLLFILLLVVSISLRKKQHSPLRFNRFLNLLFFIFLAVEAVLSAYKATSRQKEKNNLAYSTQSDLSYSTIDPRPKPDIFLIVFDEYASTAALSKYLHYDNSALDSLLSRNNFFVAAHSKSNYNSTPLSIASLLNCQYLDRPLEGKTAKALLVLQGQYTIKESLFPKLLAEQGYKIVNLGLCDLPMASATHESFFTSNAIEVLYLETLWGRIEKEIWWNVRTKTHINWTFMQSSRQVDILNTNIHNYHSALQELSTQSNTPKFVLVHLMMPHQPFFFTKDGVLRTSPYTDNPAIDDSLYIDQLKYANTWIDSIAKASNLSFHRPRAVIIAGDHGYRDKENDPALRDKQFMNLHAFYFSDRDQSLLYDSISPVNSFRVILNKYFSGRLPLLKDSTIRVIE